MKVYLAGKVRKNCWRHRVVSGLDQLSEKVGYNCPVGLSDEDSDRLGGSMTFPVMANAIFGKHDYVGPYFIRCDHGCWHAPDGHGLDGLKRQDIHGMCLAAVMRADLVFAWIDAKDCYGTITELGFAKGQGKRIVIGGPEQYADMWFPYMLADRFIQSDDPVKALSAAFN